MTFPLSTQGEIALGGHRLASRQSHANVSPQLPPWHVAQLPEGPCAQG
jgi:hypothetical protein